MSQCVSLPSSGLLVTLIRSLKCSSSPLASPAGVGMQDPCSKVTPVGKVRLSSPLGVRMWREESPPVTATSAGFLATSFLENRRKEMLYTQVQGKTCWKWGRYRLSVIKKTNHKYFGTFVVKIKS